MLLFVQKTSLLLPTCSFFHSSKHKFQKFWNKWIWFFLFLQGANHCLVYRHLAPAKVLLYKTANLDKFICLYLLVFRSHFHHLRWIPKVCCWFWLCVDFGFAQSFYYVVVVSILNVTTGWTGWPHSYNALLEYNQHQSHFHDIRLISCIACSTTQI